jgi:hypothetical protein
VPGPRPDGDARRAARIGTLIAVVAFVLLATGGRPWELFVRGPFTSDFYDAQARALSRGHLDVDPQVASIEGFVIHGKTHFYYGIVPALARLPFAAVTHAFDGRLVVLSMAIGLAVGCLAAARLLQRARRALGVAVPARWWPWITGGFAAAVGLSSPLLWLSSRALVYHEAELWGAALAILGFERIVAWWSSRRGRDLVWASVVAALALSTRGSSGIGPALALGGLAVVVAWRRAWRDAGFVLIAAAVPVALYALVNALRFGTPFSVPFDRQVLNDFSATRRAAMADNHDTLFGVKFLPTALVQYLRPDTVSPRALAPWLSWAGRADVLGGVTFDTVDRSASLPVTAPAFLVAAVVGVVATIRHRLPASWGLCLLAAAVAVVPTLTIAFIAQRYLADFVPVLVVGAALGVPVVAAWAAGSVARRRAVFTVTAVALVLGLTVNAGLAVLARNVYLLPTAAERRDFVADQYAIRDRLGGGRPPDVVEVAALGPVAADGTVAIVGDCDALYRSDGDAWVLLELRGGGPQRAVVRGATTPGPVVIGDGWQIVIEPTIEGPQLAYVGPSRVEGPRISGTDEIEVDVRADPTIPTVIVDIGGHRSFDAFLQNATGPVTPAPGWTSRTVEPKLCRDLQSRLR